ncbi:ATP-grasp domain-containing protein [Allokutzneria oryzae]|uniref:RimK family alpha-L-glutamate ligase n=1 Tax=Allokutzneria oryzae TaxID=1378989 RepID=A0ABV6A9H6_9PSEU
MSPRVLLASCAELPDSDGDDTPLPGVLAEVGVKAEWVPWDAISEPADLVVLRATWDYPHRRDEFLAWCDSVPQLANRADLVRWNTDKAYMADLAETGLRVVPTELVPPGVELAAYETEIALKPSVGAGSQGAGRFLPAERERAMAHVAALHAQGRTVVLQPYQPAVDEEGETALVFFGGRYSHAFVKGPMLPRGTVEMSALFVEERLRPTVPDGARRTLAEDALDAACELRGVERSELLYARVDVLTGTDGAPLLLELAEPSLGFRQADPGAPLRFASAVRAELARR